MIERHLLPFFPSPQHASLPYSQYIASVKTTATTPKEMGQSTICRDDEVQVDELHQQKALNEFLGGKVDLEIAAAYFGCKGRAVTLAALDNSPSPTAQLSVYSHKATQNKRGDPRVRSGPEWRA